MWRVSQGGFAIDANVTERDFVRVQGDVLVGQQGDNLVRPFDTQNLLARWKRVTGEGSDFVLQLYYDRYWRDDQTLADEMITYDADLQHRFRLGKRNTFLWGAGFRLVDDHVLNRIPAGIAPSYAVMPLYSLFVQDEMQVSESLKLTLGTRLIHNYYSGFEVQPTARLSYGWDSHTLWGAISRAVRAPSRFDKEYFLPLEKLPPEFPSVAGGPDFDSEKVYAYELGWRGRPRRNVNLSIGVFYNEYHDVYSVEPVNGTQTLQIKNGSEAESWGGELSGTWQIFDEWRLRGGFTYFNMDLRAKEGRDHNPSYLANDAKHRALLQSMTNLPFNLALDLTARYVDYLPGTFATNSIKTPEYFTFDARLAWNVRSFEVAITGQNLWKNRHTEFPTQQIPRSFYAELTWRM